MILGKETFARMARCLTILIGLLVLAPSIAVAAEGDAATPPSGGLAVVDWIIIVLYASSTIGLGWYYGRRQKTTQEYFTGSGKMNPLLIGVSLFATLLSTISYLSMPGESLGKGPVYLTNLLAYPLIFLFVGYVLLPVYMKQRVTSAYELLEANLGLSVRMLGVVMFLMLRLVWMSLLVYLTAKAIAIMIGVDESWVPAIVAVVGAVAITYTSLGGLRAVVITDLMQTILLYGGALLVIGTVTYKMGGFGWFPTEWHTNWDPQPIFPSHPSDRITVIGSIFSVLIWYTCTSGGDQVSIQRFMATEDARAARFRYWNSTLRWRGCWLNTRVRRILVARLFSRAPRVDTGRHDVERRRGQNVSAIHRLSSAAGRVWTCGCWSIRGCHVEYRFWGQFDYRGCHD